MHWSLVFTLCLSFVSSSLQQGAPSFKDLLAKQKNLTSFSDFLTGTLPDVLEKIEEQEKSGEPITILAPSNAAFDKIPYYSVIGPAWAAGNTDAQREIIKYHVLPGDITTDILKSTFQFFPTWLTNTDFANVTKGQRVGAVLQEEKLLFFVSGESNRSPSTLRDLKFAGGTVHIVDSLLVPPESFAITGAKFSTTSEPTRINSVLGAAYGNKNGSLITLINEATDITIFAPNNAAMKQVSKALTDLSEADLEDILKYHIVISDKGGDGPYYSTVLTNATSLKTLQGGSLTISSAANFLFVNSAQILTSNLLISGGVVHVIDNVLDPEDAAASPDPRLATQVPVLPTQGGEVDISSDIPFTSFVPDVTALAGGAMSTDSAGVYDGGSGTAIGTATGGSALPTGVRTGAAASLSTGSFHVSIVVVWLVMGIVW